MEEKDKIIAELKAYKDVNEDFKTAWEELKAENEKLKEENFNFEEIVKLCRCEQYKQTLQEIKAIAVRAFAKQQEYKKDFGEIIGIIANAESEG